MAKAYDRVFGFFLVKVIRNMGFVDNVVDVFWGLISNNYYSILLNGQSVSFFH